MNFPDFRNLSFKYRSKRPAVVKIEVNLLRFDRLSWIEEVNCQISVQTHKRPFFETMVMLAWRNKFSNWMNSPS